MNTSSPSISVSSVQRIVADGGHNAFVGLARWQGRHHLAFRHGRGHMDAEAGQVILESTDGQTWQEVYRHHRPNDAAGTRFDYRDSYFLAEERRLLLYSFVSPKLATGERQGAYTQVQMLEPGGRWSEPRVIIEDGRVLWKPIRLDDQQYVGAGYEVIDGQHRVALMASADGVTGWHDVAPIGPGSETVLCPQRDGSLLAIVRTEVPPYFLQFYSAEPPFATWRHVGEHERIVQGHAAFQWQSAWWLAGRERPDYLKTADPDRPSFAEHRVKLWRIHGAGGLEAALELPSAGDCAYPGVAIEADGSLSLAYYSQHETGRAGLWSAREPADIYLARLQAEHVAAP